MSKSHLLMTNVVTRYHPDFIANQELSKYALSHPQIFDIPRLVEETFAHVGGYNFVDAYGHDFDDCVLSDSKTATLTRYARKNMFNVGSVEHKVGSLRIVIYNAIANRLDFMYVPKNDVLVLKENDGTRGSASGIKQRIRGTWNEDKDHYNKMEPYRVSSFVELATMMV